MTNRRRATTAHRRPAPAAALVAALAVPLLALSAPAAGAAQAPAADGPDRAVRSAQTLDTLSRFFARDGAVARTAAAPRVEGASVPVSVLSADFVAGRAGAPVARVEYYAARAVSSDGRTASLWTVKQGAAWQVVNIATGDDETRYAAQGAAKLPGGTVFQEPQINAWYVAGGAKVLPLDEDAVRAVGSNGTTLAAYRARVQRAYGDKLPGSAYARSGKAGGYAEAPAAGAGARPVVAVASAAAGVGAVGALGLLVVTVRRRRTAPAA
ncbi:hypothetical protein ABT160_11025 [Streptomyces sp. NPDC001941]|uniref:hypothetical protein n=1 Tax=Streptomyces sp. NPDC001941 TaxID=3154659 RepID=UPI0033191B9B